jgi:hypothetical protein
MIYIDLNEGKDGNVDKEFNEQLGKRQDWLRGWSMALQAVGNPKKIRKRGYVSMPSLRLGKSSYYCESCQRYYCKDGQGRKDCKKFCFYLHICECFKGSGFASEECLQVYQDFRDDARDPWIWLLRDDDGKRYLGGFPIARRTVRQPRIII